MSYRNVGAAAQLVYSITAILLSSSKSVIQILETDPVDCAAKMTYSSLIQRLYKTNVFSPVKVGLDNMVRLNTLLGNPLKDIPIVHVTGTNGKGSVSLKISRCLRQRDIKTGLFTSPHISSF